VSTARKLLGKQHDLARDRRKQALAFYKEQSKLPGLAGLVARAIHRDIKGIARDPTLSGPDKEREFTRYLQRAARASAASAALARGGSGPQPLPSSDSVPAADVHGEVPTE